MSDASSAPPFTPLRKARKEDDVAKGQVGSNREKNKPK